MPPANWATNTYGTTVGDPLNSSNHVLVFSNNHGGGDLFSVVIPDATTYFLEFDYYFDGNVNSFGGGFVGVNAPGETWLLGDCGGCYGTQLPDLSGLTGNQWHHIAVSFTEASVGGGPTSLKLEQFTGPAGFLGRAETRQHASGGVGAGLVLLARRRR